jgi:hypothetical protein
LLKKTSMRGLTSDRGVSV